MLGERKLKKKILFSNTGFGSQGNGSVGIIFMSHKHEALSSDDRTHIKPGSAGEMDLWVKPLLHKHKDLSSNPQNPHKARFSSAHL